MLLLATPEARTMTKSTREAEAILKRAADSQEDPIVRHLIYAESGD